MTKLGLKLWSVNVGSYLQEAERLFNNHIIDYVELYSVPETIANILHWKKCSFPIVIHAAHSMHKFNLSDPAKADFNRKLFSEAVHFFKELSAMGIILHPGVSGSVEETIIQLKELISENGIKAENVLVENKPFLTLTGGLCVGSDPDAIRKIRELCGVGMVLDTTHAIKYAIAAKKPWQQVLKDFMQLKPNFLHVSDATFEHPKDEHMHIGSGEFDFREIFSICKAEFISIETNKDSSENLDDFIFDVKRLREFL
jgi:deoxyribonuclease-4